MNQILVRVRADYPWDIAQVGGRRFFKHEATQLHPHELTDEIKNSPLLDVESVESSEGLSVEPVESVEPSPLEPANLQPAKRKRGAK